ncbi:MAG: flagellar hook-basal body complex protein FliE [Proteobacteria bacterium]|nr:flagellar hook-basal body complex protein FliE [Pseudomonadota bacterium]NDC23607.1 flagellar hook-basal body complex protein FliE [Pseudomonadota bacterium]NDD03785.1 flagellar hook-basal body complex protein FliE [Pseudomonadota bacterium]NDG26319.1 flagellar hook-basal body complex protein FliE [Pseudomonadota bacterium]
MNISSISPNLIPNEAPLSSSPPTQEAKGETFTEFLSRSIDQVNDLLANADKSATDLATGKSENLHDAMITMEKAETAFKLLMQVRNKVIDAYQEVMRMQV